VLDQSSICLGEIGADGALLPDFLLGRGKTSDVAEQVTPKCRIFKENPRWTRKSDEALLRHGAKSCDYWATCHCCKIAVTLINSLFGEEKNARILRLPEK